MIFQDQPLSTGALACYPYSIQRHDWCKFKATDGTIIDMGVQAGDRLFLPRNLCPVGAKDLRCDGAFSFVQSIAKPPRTQEQADLINASITHLQSGQDHVVEAPTGFGKTYIGAAAAAVIGKPTLIVVTKEDLMEQWRLTLLNLIGVNPSEIGKVQAAKIDYKGKRFVLGMVHTLARPGKFDEHPEIIDYFGTIVFDEVHRLGADYFAKVASMFPAKHRLGLSATPKRYDGKMQLIHAHLGPTALKGTTVPMSPKILVKRTAFKLPDAYQKADNGQWVKSKLRVIPGRLAPVLKALAKDKDRNALITEFVLAAYKAGRRIVVMSDLIEDHLLVLFKCFAAAGVPGEDMDYYIGGRNQKELEVAKQKRVCLATYSMCGEGTDVPWWDCLVMATPRVNVKQAIGRVIRQWPDKQMPVILDLVDPPKVLENFYSAREHAYYSVGATIVRMAA